MNCGLLEAETKASMSVSSSKSVKSVDSNLDCSQCRKLSSECLLDGFLALYEECCHENLARNKNVSIFLKKCEYPCSSNFYFEIFV